MNQLKMTNNLHRRIKQGVNFALVGTMLATAGVSIKINKNKRDNGRYHELYQTTALTTKEIEVLQGVNIYVDGLPFTSRDINGVLTNPFIYDGTTYLPVRSLATSFGIDIDWNETEKAVEMSLKNIQVNNGTEDREPTPLTATKVKATTGVRLLVNGADTVLMDVNGNTVEPLVVDGTTYLPVRAISDLFQVGICWNQPKNIDGTSTSYSNIYIGKIYHNVNQETNDTMIECVNQVDKVKPYLEPVGVRQLRIMEAYAYSIDIASFIRDLNDEVDSAELKEVCQRVFEYRDKLEQLNIRTQGIATLPMAEHIKYTIFNYPMDLKNENLDFNDLGIITHYSQMMKDTLTDYEDILNQTKPEEIQKYYDDLNTIYNEAVTIYNHLVPTKTLQYK